MKHVFSRPAFYLYAGLKLMSGLLMLAINLEFKSPATNVIRDVFSVLRNIETAALFIACFVLGEKLYFYCNSTDVQSYCGDML